MIQSLCSLPKTNKHGKTTILQFKKEKRQFLVLSTKDKRPREKYSQHPMGTFLRMEITWTVLRKQGQPTGAFPWRLICFLINERQDCSIHQCLFCCLVHRVIVTIFLNSIYMR